MKDPMSRAKTLTQALGACGLVAGFCGDSWAKQAELPSRSSAGGGRIELSLAGPGECPNASALHDQVQKLARLPADAPHRLEAHLLIEPTEPDRLRLLLTASLDGAAPGERTFIGASCAEVTDAAALTLALMLNPDAAPPDEEAAAPSPASALQPAAPPARERAAPSPRSAPRIHAFAGLTAGGRVGVMPSVSPEAGAAVGVSLNQFSSGLGVLAAPPQTAHTASGQFGGRFWALSGTWLACWAPLDDVTIQLGPCAGVGLTRLAGSGVGVTHPHDSETSWVSGTLGLSTALALGSRVTVRALVLGAVPATRPTFYLQGLGPVHQPAAVSASLQGTVAIRLF